MTATIPRTVSAAAANACPIRATARPSRAWRPRSRRCAPRIAAGLSRRGAARGACRRRRPQRARLRLVGPRGQALRQPRSCDGRADPLAARHDRLHDQPRHARGDGRRGARRPPTGRCSRSSSAAPTATSSASRPCAGRRPDATLIADANEGWTEENLARHLAACAEAGIALVEQPLPAGRRRLPGTHPAPVPICADESVHDRGDLDRLVGLYDAVNIKLDKTGGLTEAIALARCRAGAAGSR